MRQWPDEQTRTPKNACLYQAEVVIDGKRYSARSRRGAPFALARVLVAAGVLDQPVSLTHEGLRGAMTYRSLYRLATRTIEESVRTPIGDRQFREFPEREGVGEGTVIAAAAPGGEPENGGSGTPADVEPILPLELAECGACGQQFYPPREWSRYCSARCKQRAKRARREVAPPTGAQREAGARRSVARMNAADAGQVSAL